MPADMMAESFRKHFDINAKKDDAVGLKTFFAPVSAIIKEVTT
jgi:hypothetical protein